MADFSDSRRAPSAQPPLSNCTNRGNLPPVDRRAMIAGTLAAALAAGMAHSAPAAITAPVGAALASGAFEAHSGQAHRAAWEAAEAAYLRAQAAMNAFDRDHLTPAVDRLDQVAKFQADTRAGAKLKRATAAYERAQDRFDDLVIIEHEAFHDLCTQPAPDLSAVTRKMEMIALEKRWERDDIGELLQSVYADLRRLRSVA